MTSPAVGPSADADAPSMRWSLTELLWPALGVGLFAATAAIAYRPALDGPGAVAAAALPLVVVAGLVLSLASDAFGLRARVAAGALVATIGAWAVLLAGDDRWSIVGIAVYAACYRVFAESPRAAVASTATVTAIWAAAWATGDNPRWTVAVPLGAFAAGTAMYAALRELGRLNRSQAQLIEDLERTRDELASAERARGALEERAWIAGEIHDTLAQGFTSIVLLSRAAQRDTAPRHEDLVAIEATAADNLATARQLVAAEDPSGVAGGALTDSLRQVVETVPEGIDARYRVEGDPRPLGGRTDALLLRALQELLRNVTTHSRASSVAVTLSFLGEVVALDVRDDGVGFAAGQVTDRGALTGGQGLAAIRRRAEALGGHLEIEGAAGGAVVSLQLPVPR